MENTAPNDSKTTWFKKFIECLFAGIAFGLGFERMVQFVIVMTNIRYVIAFARTPNTCEF